MESVALHLDLSTEYRDSQPTYHVSVSLEFPQAEQDLADSQGFS